MDTSSVGALRAGSVQDDQSSLSSPDPLNASQDSMQWPSARRMTRSQSRSLQSRRLFSLGSSNSPRKQTFQLDVGGSRTPSRLLVTVETEEEHAAEFTHKPVDHFGDTKRNLFGSTPAAAKRGKPVGTPIRKSRSPTKKRAGASATTTTVSVPLRDADAPGAITPKRRGRPKRAATPMKQTPGRTNTSKRTASPSKKTPGRPPKRTRLSEERTDGDVPASVASAGATPNTRGRKRKSVDTPNLENSSKRSRPLRPRSNGRLGNKEAETIIEAHEEPARTASGDASSHIGDSNNIKSDSSNAENTLGEIDDFGIGTLGGIEGSNEVSPPPDDTVAQEDFSMIFANSIPSLSNSMHQPPQETQELGEATSLIINRTLEELRQSRGTAHDEEEQDNEEQPAITEPQRTESDENNISAYNRESSQVDQNDHAFGDAEQSGIGADMSLDKPQSSPAREAEKDQAPRPETSQTAQSAYSHSIAEDPQRYLGAAVPRDAEPLEGENEGSPIAENDAPDMVQLGYTLEYGEIETMPASSPAAHSTPYVDDFSEIPQKYLDAAAPRGVWPPPTDDEESEMNQDDTPTKPQEVRAPEAGETQNHESAASPAAQSAPRVMSAQPVDDQSDTDPDAIPNESHASATKMITNIPELAPVTAQSTQHKTWDEFSEGPRRHLDDAIYRESLASAREGSEKGTPSPTKDPSKASNANLLAPRSMSAELGTRPSLSPIVRAGIALQSVTSDASSPRSRQESLGSPFRPVTTPRKEDMATEMPSGSHRGNMTLASIRASLAQESSRSAKVFKQLRDNPSQVSSREPTPIQDNQDSEEHRKPSSAEVPYEEPTQHSSSGDEVDDNAYMLAETARASSRRSTPRQSVVHVDNEPEEQPVPTGAHPSPAVETVATPSQSVVSASGQAAEQSVNQSADSKKSWFSGLIQKGVDWFSPTNAAAHRAQENMARGGGQSVSGSPIRDPAQAIDRSQATNEEHLPLTVEFDSIRAAPPNEEEMNEIREDLETQPAPREELVFQGQAQSLAMSVASWPSGNAEISENSGKSSSREEQVSDAEEEDDDIWAIEAQRDSTIEAPQAKPNNSGRPRQKPFGKNPDQRHHPYARSSKRAVIPSPWKRMWSDNESADQSMVSQQQEAEDPRTNSMLKQSIQNNALNQTGHNSAGNSGRFDLSSFFSSPNPLPGAENAQQVLFHKRVTAAPTQRDDAQRSTTRRFALPTASMFPTATPQAESPAELPSNRPNPFALADTKRRNNDAQGSLRMPLSAASASRQNQASSPPKSSIKQPVSALRKVAFPPAEAPGQTSITGTPLRSRLTTAEIEKWQEQTEEPESSSPVYDNRLRFLRSLPDKGASPTKSCMRSPLKARTPGPVVTFDSDVLSPTMQAQKRLERRAKKAYLEEYAQRMANGEFNDQDEREHREYLEWLATQDVEMTDASFSEQDETNELSLPPLPSPGREQGPDDSAIHEQALQEQIIEDQVQKEMRQEQASERSTPRQVKFVQQELQEPREQQEQLIQIHEDEPEQEDQREDQREDQQRDQQEDQNEGRRIRRLRAQRRWTDGHYIYLDDLIQMRRKGPFPFDLPADFVPQSRWLVGRTMSSHEEPLRLNPWHISIIDAFQSKFGGLWTDLEIARRLYSLLMVQKLHDERRQPKMPYVHKARAATVSRMR